MQKCIRRAMAEDAVFWALELYARFHEYVPTRLRVIACEDIGLADLFLVNQVMTQMAALPDAAASREEKAGLIATIVYNMAMAKKSRETDDFGHHVRREMRLGQIPRLTDGMTWTEIVEMLEANIDAGNEKTVLAICVESLNGFANLLWAALMDLALRRLSDPVTLGIVFGVQTLVRDLLKRKGSYECVPLSMVVLLLCRTEVSPVAGDIGRLAQFQVLNGHLRPIPDFARDKHTSSGRAMGRDIKQFNDEGTLLVNEGYPSRYIFWTDDGCGSYDKDGNKVRGIWVISDHLEALGARPATPDFVLQPALF